jgi:hypothetical protein
MGRKIVQKTMLSVLSLELAPPTTPPHQQSHLQWLSPFPLLFFLNEAMLGQVVLSKPPLNKNMPV